MGKYTQDAAKLLELVGGKENIAAVSHCMTRMRFVLNDPALANIEAIEAIHQLFQFPVCPEVSDSKKTKSKPNEVGLIWRGGAAA